MEKTSKPSIQPERHHPGGHPHLTHGQHLSHTAATERALHDHHMAAADFNLAPFTIAWEVTRACAFACVHCRADAQHRPDPRQLTNRESIRLIERLKDFGSPILIFTGGDPMMR